MSVDVQTLSKQQDKALGVVKAGNRRVEVEYGNSGRRAARAFGTNAQAAARNLASSLPGVGAGLGVIGGPAGIAAGVAMAGFAVAMRKAADTAQVMDDLAASATKIGVTAEALQGLRYAAEANDIPIDKLDEGLRSLNASIGAMQTGVGNAKIGKAFAALDISPEQLANIKTADQLLPLLADKIKGLGSQAAQVKLSKAVGAEDLLPLLQQGGKAVDGYRAKFKSLDLEISEGAVQSAADMNEELRIAGERSDVAGKKLSLSFIPILVQLKNRAADASLALAGMFNWLTKMPSVNEAADRLDRNAETARQRARDARAGSGFAALAGGATGLQALTQQGRNQAAARMDADAARLEATAATLRLNAAKAADAAAKAAAARAKVDPPVVVEPPSGGGRGGRSRAAPVVTGDVYTDAERNADLALAYEHAVKDLADEFSREFMRGVQQPLTFEGVNTEAVDTAVAQWNAAAEELHDRLEYAVAGGLEAGIRGGWPGLLEYMAQSLERSLIASASDSIATVLQGVGGGGGLLGKLGAAATGLFGGSKLAGIAASTITRNPYLFAGGTDYAPGGLSVVGERGRELLNIPRGGQVIPNDILRNLSKPGATGGGAVHFHLEGAVLTSDLVNQMNAIGKAQGSIAAASAFKQANRGMPARLASYQSLGR